jgi:tetratricopeptide (TPR) repeat protein
MYFYGDLEHSPLPDALAFLGREEASGVLSCQSGKIFKQITFSGGCVVSVLSNQPDERLGRSLVRRGILSTGQVREALKAQARLDMKLGEVLLSLGILDRTSLAEELVCQASGGLTSLFAWKQGHFIFQSKRVGIPPDHPVWLDAAPVVFRELLSSGSTLEERVDPDGLVALRRPQRSPAFNLGAEALSVLHELRFNKWSLEQLRQSLGMNKLRLVRILIGLDVIGLVEVPLQANRPVLLGDLLAFYRSVLRGMYLQTDVEKGGRGLETLHEGWNAGPFGASPSDGSASGTGPAPANARPQLRLDAEGLLAVTDEEAWKERSEPELLRAFATDLDAAVLSMLMALKERFGVPLLESVITNLKLTAPLHFRRHAGFHKFVEAGWENLLQIPLRLQTNFEQGMANYEAGDLTAAGRYLGQVSSDHAAYLQAREILQRIAPNAEPREAVSAPAAAPIPEVAARRATRSRAAHPRPRQSEEFPSPAEIEGLLQEAVELLQSGELAAAISRCLLVVAWDPGNRRARELLDEAKNQAERASAPARTEADLLWAEASAELEAALQQAEGRPGTTTEKLWQDDSGEVKVDWTAEETADRLATHPPTTEPGAVTSPPVVADPQAVVVTADASAPPAVAAPTAVVAPNLPPVPQAPTLAAAAPPPASVSEKEDSPPGPYTAAENAALLYREAQNKLTEKGYQAALGLFRLILARDPSHALARQGEARALEGVQAHEQIEAFLEQARLSEQLGRASDAIGHLEKVLKLDHQRPEVLRRLQSLQGQLVEQVHQTHGGPSAKPRLCMPLEKVREQDLEIDEGFIISQIDGRTDLKTLALISGLGTSKTYRLILSLLERGYIEIPPPRKGRSER